MLRMSEVNSTNHQAMQHLLTQASVDWQGLGDAVATETDALLGGDDSLLLIDESAFCKKGEASAGVSRQWNGRLGKVDNCQVGVFAALCRGEHASLVDARLYLPKTWAEDAARCDKAAIPLDERKYRSKSTLALEMIDTAVRRGLRFGAIAVDGGYGKEPAFLRQIDERHLCFMADVHCDQHIYIENPNPTLPAYSGRGRRPTQAVAQGSTMRVDHWSAAQPAEAWRRLHIRNGEKGAVVAEYLHARVWRWDGQEQTPHCWHLLVRREVGALMVSHYYCLSNAPEQTSLNELARLQAQRFFIEHSFRETKSECGLADYQVRRWDAWHHHMALVMLGALFLVKEKITARAHAPMLSLNDLVTVLRQLLPPQQPTVETLAATITQRHRMRLSAKASHSRRAAGVMGNVTK